MEELSVIETTSGRQFKPWASREDVQAIKQETVQAVGQAVQDPASVTAIASEIASGKQAIASAINAKGGSASATESFAGLAQDIQDTPTSGVLSTGIVQSAPFRFMDYVCKSGGYPFTEIDDDSVTVISKSNSFAGQVQLLKVRMSALGAISGGSVFSSCAALQNVTLPNLTTISGGYTFRDCAALQNVTLPNLTTISGAYTFYNCAALQNITLPNLTTISGGDTFFNCYALRNLIMGTMTTMSEPFANVKPNLRNITIGQDTNINLPFQNWNASNVIAKGQSGIDELNTNLQTNLISKLYQGGGKILRLGAALYDVTTQETRDMVTAKGWTLQRG